MILVGLTGGIASGKSHVSRHFKRLGAHLIDADELARDAVAPGTAAWDAIRSRFGEQILAGDGKVDRKKLAEIVFRDERERAWLNSVVHPEVFRRQEEECRRIERVDSKAVVIYDAALLIETGAYRRMDKVVLVVADPATQVRRMVERDGFTKQEAESRIAAQAPVAEKKEHADYVVDGTLPREAVEAEVARIFAELTARA